MKDLETLQGEAGQLLTILRPHMDDSGTLLKSGKLLAVELGELLGPDAAQALYHFGVAVARGAR